jgi:hypothetical protein
MHWGEQRRCIHGHSIPLNRFVSAFATEHEKCPQCGGALAASAFYEHREVSVSRVGERLKLPLSQLGVDSPRGVQLRRSGHSTLIAQKPPDPF